MILRSSIALVIGLASLAAADGLAEARRQWSLGESAGAIATLRSELAAHQADAEVAATLGQYLGLSGESAEAETLLASAIAREPANPDHHLRLALVLRRAGRNDKALAAAERACALAPDYAEASAVRDSLRPERRLWRLDLGVAGDRYSAIRDDENEVFISLARTVAPGVAVVIGLDQQHRYGLDDQRYDLSLYGPLSGSVSGWLRLGVSPDNQFLPDYEAEAAAAWTFASDWQAGLRLTHRAFPAEHILMPRPSLRWDMLPHIGVELAYLWALSDQQQTTRTAEVRLHLNDGGHWSGSLGFSSGEENNPPLPVGQVDVWSASLLYQPTRTWGLRVDASHEIREDLYTRNGLGLGATLRF
jgi:YaiO family outer membrane protein